jgi:hypothetical protein
VLTFEKLLGASHFAEWVRGMVRTLADAHRFPIEVELTGNFDRTGRLRLNLVQCRPLRVLAGGEAQQAPDVGEGAVVLASRGPIVGRSRSTPVDRVTPSCAPMMVQERSSALIEKRMSSPL